MHPFKSLWDRLYIEKILKRTLCFNRKQIKLTSAHISVPYYIIII